MSFIDRVRQWLRPQRQDEEAPLRRMSRWLQHRPSVIAYVRPAFPAGDPGWVRIVALTDDVATTSQGGRLVLADDVPFVLTYPDGEIADAHNAGTHLPPGVYFMETPAMPQPVELFDDDLRGPEVLRIMFERSPIRPHHPHHYATHVQNVGSKPVKIVKFGAFRREGGRWHLSSASDDLYGAAQFASWYGLESETLQPGETGIDIDNYGAAPMLWAYRYLTPDGEERWAGAVLTEPPAR